MYNKNPYFQTEPLVENNSNYYLPLLPYLNINKGIRERMVICITTKGRSKNKGVPQKKW
jgi:hypothetical protein